MKAVKENQEIDDRQFSNILSLSIFHYGFFETISANNAEAPVRVYTIKRHFKSTNIFLITNIFTKIIFYW